MNGCKKEFFMISIDRLGEQILVDCYVYTHVENYGEYSDGRRGWPVLKVDDVIIVSSYLNETFTEVTLTEEEKNEACEIAANKALGR